VERLVVRGCVLTAALALAGGPVAAQQVEVRVVVPQTTAKEIRAAIDRSIRQAIDARVLTEISREISVAVHEGLAGAHIAAREITEALRQSTRHGDAGGTPGAARQDRTFTQEQIARETHNLAIGPSGTLVLRNIAGDVTVTAGTGRSATVEATRRSRGRTDADAKLGLERVRIEVDHRGERATVTSRYPDDERRPPYAVTTSYVVTAPAGTMLTVSTLSGTVSVKDIKGDVNATVTSGTLTVAGSRISMLKTLSGNLTVTDSDAEAGMELSTLSGLIRVERAKAKRVSISALSGDVVARDVETTTATVSNTSGDVEYAGTLAKGGRYELRAHSGDVKVILPKGGFDVSARTFSGRIIADAALGLPTSTQNLVRSSSLKGTVGDGSATLDVSTFSGDVTISRKQ
jgi:hypothetical protein